MGANKNIGTGQLFQDTAKSVFMRVTGQRYDNMLERVKRKGFYGLPFSKEEFRMVVLCAMRGNYDGYFRCPYCNGFFSLEQVSVDHALPLGRGGGVEIDNLEFPCQPCNNRKGKMTPEDYQKLLKFLDNEIPLSKTDVLQRLEIAVQLAAGNRHRKKQVQKESALGPF